MPTTPPENLVEGLRRLGPFLAQWPHPAALVGGVAIIARVLPRHTNDVDVVLAVPPGTSGDLLALASRHGFLLDPGDAELAQEGLFRLFLPPSREAAVGVDLIAVDSEFLRKVVDRATPVDLGVCTLPVATVEDLLLLKLEANRPQDIDDILSIKDAFAETLDLAYVRSEAARLSLTPVLDLYFGA